MGCDIHCYMEFRRRDAKRWDGSTPDFDGWPRINPGRNYAIFSKLTGGEVRGYRDGDASMKPRGLPSDESCHTAHDYWLYIDYLGDASGENEASPADARRYVEYYHKTTRGEFRPFTSTFSVIENGETVTRTETRGAEFDGKPTHVEHPDWHSASWVTSDELARAIEGEDEPEYAALLAAMRSLEASGHDTRLVFWFDN